MNIIITGVSRGIGYEIVKEFTRQFDCKIIGISRNKEKLKLLKEECLQINNKTQILPIAFDLKRLLNNETEELLNVLGTEKQVDILINNAGYLVKKPFQEFNIAEIQNIFEINFYSPSLLIQKLLPYMGKDRKSHIVNIGSMGGFQGSSKYPGLSFYSAGKASLACLTECLATEFKESNISVNYLALGAVQTEMLEEAFPGYKAPLTAGEMAEFIVDFSVNAGKYLNGKIIPVSLTNP